MLFGENYKRLILIPLALLILSIGILVSGYSQTGEWFERSIELKGGTSLTINSDTPLDKELLEQTLEELGDFNVREIRGLDLYSTIISFDSQIDSEIVLEKLEQAGFDVRDISLTSIGPSLGESFWSQAQLAIIIAFIFMGIIVFFIFKTVVPSVAVIASAASDIIVTLALMQVFGIQLSLAGFAALLMLIGYSVDTDIMLTSRLLKESEEKTVNNKLRRAMKTGLTMTFTSIVALSALFISSISVVLTEIAAVLLIGLFVDIINTWFMNAVILKWYIERGGKTDA